MDRLWMVGVLAVVFSSIVMVESTNPGLKIKVTKNGLKYVSEIGVELLNKTLTDIQIPGTSGSVHFDNIGGMNYNINLKITNFDLPGATISTVSDTGLKASISNVKIGVHADWSLNQHFGLIHIRDGGSDNVTASFNLTLSLVIKVGNKGGQFAISTSGSQCVYNLESLDVDVNREFVSSHTFFEGPTFVDEIQKYYTKQVCDQIINAVNGPLAERVADIKLVHTRNIPVHGSVDYSLVSAPEFSEGGFQSFHMGNCERWAIQPPPAFPAHTETSRMLYLWLGKGTLELAVFGSYKEQVQEYNMTNDVVLSGLNSSMYLFRKLLPQSSARHYASVIFFKVLNPPTFTLTAGSLESRFYGHFSFFAPSHLSFAVVMDLSVNVKKKRATTLTYNLTLVNYKLNDFISPKPNSI
ncbi:bactericidal permeability-increasing protein-like isoform X2 [Antedon mediterranea]|uniref:bactericidal permeability-increasing protein-like isoform X2 n=1 Tax=Antedon mediterranea TaxID=105859 RepID=UPI003AF985C7